MGRSIKEQKQEYRDRINALNKQLRTVQGQLAAKPKTVTVQAPVDTSKYTSQIDSLTKQLQSSQSGANSAAANYRAAQARASADYGAKLGSMQNLYASNLQSTKDQFGLQISGLQKNITDQAAGYQQNIADQAAQFKSESQTMATNQERARLAGATPELQLQDAANQKIGGTKAFKRRVGSQFNTPSYGSLASIKSGTLNI
tara:strand:- start:5673 stop:6275 length:603 start_codon:yes stop_codon:yes gene_type:complete